MIIPMSYIIIYNILYIDPKTRQELFEKYKKSMQKIKEANGSSSKGNTATQKKKYVAVNNLIMH